MYQVEYYVNGVELQVLSFNTKKEAQKDMIAFIDEDRSRLNKNGYKRIGNLKSNYIEYRHAVFGVDSFVKLRED